ncbi:hypothetical protein [Deinococcus sp. Leaf326]|uniref:hypothetical protein n=1 Tax=Deinococcus sp. Leaf326 TaxID=1736338 RepID=UPI0006F59E85|nr:hypothetical protein [Deinococcus sp. Leaf326]KQR27808.1 hypothetical protein ASF71_04170 [Deinococcus sp. Leaf326]
MTIGKRMLGSVVVGTAFGLAGVAGAQCVRTPVSAYNGLVKIEYPRGGGGASVQRACDAGARQLAADVMAAGKANGVPVRWVEVYGVRNWGSTFHDLIYKTRALGYGQVGFSKFNALPRTRQSNKEQVVYANSSGKYVAQFSYTEGLSTANTATVFVLYGN